MRTAPIDVRVVEKEEVAVVLEAVAGVIVAVAVVDARGKDEAKC